MKDSNKPTRNAANKKVLKTDDLLTSAIDYLPKGNSSLNTLRKAATDCEGCDLYMNATQTVFGQGNPKAKIMLVGEQPGDKEDLEGLPFIGPSGKLLDSALDAAGIDKSTIYVTNAVKHFKFEVRGKRRLHKQPRTIEIDACRPWLQAEITKIRPSIIVCLGATAAKSLFEKNIKISEFRGQFLQSEFGYVLVTVHPSSILRLIDSDERHAGFKELVKDLKKLKNKL